MNTIKLSVEQFNEIMDMAKKNTDPISFHTIWTVVFLEALEGALRASAVHGSRAGYIAFPYDDKVEDMRMIIPVVSKLKKQDVFCEITESESEVLFKTARGSTSVRRETIEWFDCSKFLPKDEPKEVFYSDTKNLINALSVFEGTVKIEYRGATSPLVVEQGEKKVLALPIHPKTYHN